MRPFRRRTRGRLRGLDDGAAAVEFALVLPVLLLILFGIVDYGLFFSNSIQSRSGVHDAARGAAVAPSSGGTTSCGSTIVAPTDIARLICAVLKNTENSTATRYVDVQLPNGWQVDSPLIVCERLDTKGITGYVPLPGRGQIRSSAVLTIEQDSTDLAWTQKADPQDYGDVLPDGDWTWCKP